MPLPDVYKYDGLERTSREWSRWLSSNAHAFGGNADNAGQLMVKFMRGRRFVIERFKTRGIEIPAPEIKLTKPEPSDPFYHHAALNHYWSAIRRNITWVNLDQLEVYSSHDVTTRFIIPDLKRVNTVHTGSIKDYYSLVGAEETHHAFWSHSKGGFQSQDELYGSGSVTNHDAIDIEFRALLVVLKFAQTNNLPPETLSTIRDRIKNAREVRTDKTAK